MRRGSEVGLTEGDHLLGEYRVERPLGKGGYGSVYLVISEITGERFALKRALVEDETGRRELLAEIGAWTNMPASPHVAAYRFFRSAGTTIYIFAEYVEGGSLADRVAARQLYEGGNHAALHGVLDAAIQAAWGLAAAHLAGIVHQDVKPSNVLVAADGVVKIADFGLSQRRQADPRTEQFLDMFVRDIGPGLDAERMRRAFRDRLSASDQSVVAGDRGFTGQYASPEQLAGTPVSHATDIWSWGVMLLELCNGACTWELGDDAPTALRHIAERGPAVAGAPRLTARLAGVLARCLQTDRAARWPSISDAADEAAAAYEEALGRPFPRSRPSVDVVSRTVFTREMASGASWVDPRPWLEWAYEVAGKTAADAAPHFPERTGTATARAVSDLMALEHAAEIGSVALASGDPAAIRGIGTVHVNLGQVALFLGDTAGAIRHYDDCIRLLRPLTDPDARTTLVEVLRSRAVALQHAGRDNESIAVCDEALQLWSEANTPRPFGEHDTIRARLLHTKANGVADIVECLTLRREALALHPSEDAARAKYLSSIGAVHARQGQWADADRAFQSAQTLCERLNAAGGSFEVRQTLGYMLLNRGRAERGDARFAAADDHLNRAAAILEPLAVESTDANAAIAAGEARFERGIALEALARHREALGEYDRARAHLSDAVLDGGRSDLAGTLGDAWRNAANLRRALGGADEALAVATQAVDLFRRLHQRDQRPAHVSLLATALSVRGGCLPADRIAEACACSQEAADLLRSLPAEERSRQRDAFAGVLLDYGVTFRAAGDRDAAWNAYAEALDMMSAADPGEPLRLKARLFQNASAILGDAGQFAASVELLDNAIAAFTSLEDRLGERYCGIDLAMAHRGRAVQMAALGRYSDARDAAAQAEARTRAMMSGGGRDDLRRELATSTVIRARASKRLGELDDAARAFDESAELLKAAVAVNPSADMASLHDHCVSEAEDLRELAAYQPHQVIRWWRESQRLLQRGEARAREGAPGEASELMEDAVIICRELAARNPDAQWVRILASAEVNTGMALMYAGRVHAAEDGLRRGVAAFDRLVRELGKAEELGNWGKACLGLAEFLVKHGRAQEYDELMRSANERMRAGGEPGYSAWVTVARQVLNLS